MLLLGERLLRYGSHDAPNSYAIPAQTGRGGRSRSIGSRMSGSTDTAGCSSAGFAPDAESISLHALR
jgi:hypothetical protein